MFISDEIQTIVESEFERSFIKTHGNENIFNKSNKLHENQIKVFNKQDQLFGKIVQYFQINKYYYVFSIHEINKWN